MFDSDCREGSSGACSLVIKGIPHGGQKGTTACQLHMRNFKNGETITVEPWRARAALSYVAPGGIEVYIPLAGLVDLDKEIARLEKESGAVSRELERVRGKLANESFLAKAPPEVIDKERDKEADLGQKLATIDRRLAQFGG